MKTKHVCGTFLFSVTLFLVAVKLCDNLPHDRLFVVPVLLAGGLLCLFLPRTLRESLFRPTWWKMVLVAAWWFVPRSFEDGVYDCPAVWLSAWWFKAVGGP